MPFVNTGVIDVKDIRADVRLKDCNNDIYHSCDTYGSSMLLLQHDYDEETLIQFISSSDDDYGNADICSPRLLLHTEAFGGLPETEEMPDELRPLIVWPPSIQLEGAGLGNIQCSLFSYTRGANTNNVQSGPITGGINFTGINNNGWPIYGKNGVYSADLIVFFDKLSCPEVQENATLDFNYWTKGDESYCHYPTTYFTTDPAREEIALLVGGINASVSLLLAVFKCKRHCKQRPVAEICFE